MGAAGIESWKWEWDLRDPGSPEGGRQGAMAAAGNGERQQQSQERCLDPGGKVWEAKEMRAGAQGLTSMGRT